MYPKLLQIVPATDHVVAVFSRSGTQVTRPVFCWALVEHEDGGRAIHGLISYNGALMDVLDYADKKTDEMKALYVFVDYAREVTG